MTAIEAVVFDLDGVLVDSEHVWDEVREELARERGGRWHERAQADMMGMSSTEWSRYMHDVIGLAEPPEEIDAEVVRRMQARYAERLPLVDGAVDAVQRLGAAFRLGLASSSNRPLIDRCSRRRGSRVVRRDGLVGRGGTREACARRLPRGGASAGRRARSAAPRSRTRRTGSAQREPRACACIAIPNRRYPPPPDALALADVVLRSLAELTVEAVSGADVAPGPPTSSPPRA